MGENMSVNFEIREMKAFEYGCLKDFLYEAIFIPENAIQPPRSIVDTPQLQVYIENFGTKKSDHALVAIVDHSIVGVIWTRIMKDYGHVDEHTPSLAMALYKAYRGKGIGTALLKNMCLVLKEQGYAQVSLSVQKENYAYKMYQHAGFYCIQETMEEYLMVNDL